MMLPSQQIWADASYQGAMATFIQFPSKNFGWQFAYNLSVQFCRNMRGYLIQLRCFCHFFPAPTFDLSFLPPSFKYKTLIPDTAIFWQRLSDWFLAVICYMQVTAVESLEGPLLQVEGLGDLRLELHTKKLNIHLVLIDELHRHLYIKSTSRLGHKNRDKNAARLPG